MTLPDPHTSWRIGSSGQVARTSGPPPVAKPEPPPVVVQPPPRPVAIVAPPSPAVQAPLARCSSCRIPYGAKNPRQDFDLCYWCYRVAVAEPAP